MIVRKQYNATSQIAALKAYGVTDVTHVLQPDPDGWPVRRSTSGAAVMSGAIICIDAILHLNAPWNPFRTTTDKLQWAEMRQEIEDRIRRSQHPDPRPIEVVLWQRRKAEQKRARKQRRRARRKKWRIH